jgi:acyl-CoA thioester hydrolase
MSAPFVYEFRVRFAECDGQGVVFNSNYLAFVDVGITELWRDAVPGGYIGMLDEGVDVVVAEAHLTFRSSARFDDLLRIEVTVTHLGTTSIVTQHRFCRGDELLVEVEIRHVTVSRDGYRKTPMPDWLRSGLAQWLEPQARSPEPEAEAQAAEPG